MSGFLGTSNRDLDVLASFVHPAAISVTCGFEGNLAELMPSRVCEYAICKAVLVQNDHAGNELDILCQGDISDFVNLITQTSSNQDLPDAVNILMACCSNFLCSMDALPSVAGQMAGSTLSLEE